MSNIKITGFSYLENEDKTGYDITLEATTIGEKGALPAVIELHNMVMTSSLTSQPAEPETPPPARRATKAAAPKKTSRRKKADKDAGDITDEDMSKAASSAAETLGTDSVKELVGEFNVESVGDIKQEERAEFLRVLKQDVAKASA